MLEISVVIPTYNRVEILSRAIQSVLNQTSQPMEILVIDDGSTDETVSKIAMEFPKVQILSQENRGVSAARNLGIRHAKSEWIAFLDSDDEWLPNKIEMQKQEMHYHKNIKICHTDEIWIRNGVRVNPMKKHQKFGGEIYSKCLPLCVISPSSVLIHKSIFDNVGLFDESFLACEDYELWLRICARYPVLFVEIPLLRKYGGHIDQLSKKYSSMDSFRIRAMEKILADNVLNEKQRYATIQMLREKTIIYRNGAEKRRKKSEVERMNKILQKYKEC